jgi:hypothetical protein
MMDLIEDLPDPERPISNNFFPEDMIWYNGYESAVMFCPTAVIT